MNERYFDKKNDRDDADARGEHSYGDEPPRDERRPNPLARKPGHYAAGADGTHDVSGPSEGIDVPAPDVLPSANDGRDSRNADDQKEG